MLAHPCLCTHIGSMLSCISQLLQALLQVASLPFGLDTWPDPNVGCLALEDYGQLHASAIARLPESCERLLPNSRV